MSERLRSIDEKGIWEKIGSVLPGILGWANMIVRQENKTKTPAMKHDYQERK